MSTSPILTSQVSVSTSKVDEKSGKARTGAVIKASFNYSNETLASSDHLNASFLSRSVKGLLMMPYPWMNLL